jgi:hypothetical protein
MFARLAAAGAFATVFGVASVASAQGAAVVGPTPTPTYERAGFENKVPAPMDAFELTAGAGYTQPFGRMRSGRDFRGVAHEGMGVELGLGLRVAPKWSLGIDGSFQELNAMTGTGIRGVQLGVDATYHASPFSRVDPFAQIGLGYRGLWQRNPAGTPDVITHGIELARLSLGLDFRASRNVALGPMIGGDLDMFMWQTTAGGGTAAIAAPRLSTFVFAGLQGRFDIGGDRVTESEVIPALADR